MNITTLPGIVKKITIFNSELIYGINQMTIENRLEILFGIDVENGTNRKEVLASVLNNIMESDLTESEIMILTSILNRTKEKLKSKM